MGINALPGECGVIVLGEILGADFKGDQAARFAAGRGRGMDKTIGESRLNSRLRKLPSALRALLSRGLLDSPLQYRIDGRKCKGRDSVGDQAVGCGRQTARFPSCSV